MAGHLRALLIVAAAVMVAAVAGCPAKSAPGTAATDPDWNDGTKVLFVGDTDFGESYKKMDPRILLHGYDYGFEKTRPLIERADFVIANLETPITDPEANPSPFAGKKDYIHYADVVKAPEYLKKYKINTVNLANNHILDHGVGGLKQTLEVLAQNGMTGFGAGLTQADAEKPFEKDLTVDGRTVRLAVFGAFEYSKTYEEQYAFYAKGDLPGVAVMSADRTAQLVRDYKAAHPDAFVVVYPHWGGNYQWRNKSQKEIATAVMDAGADALIGQGAHCLQQFQKMDGRWVMYNIGNFMFNSPGRYKAYIKKKKIVPYGLAAMLRFTEADGALRVDARAYPILADNRKSGYQPAPATDEAFAGIQKRLAKKMDKDHPNRFAKAVGTGKDSFGNYFELRLR